MRIDSAAGLAIGATVLVTVGLLQAVGATVVWVEKDWAGVKFAVDVNPDEARGKAVIAPKTLALQPGTATDVVPTAGWIDDLSTPFGNRGLTDLTLPHDRQGWPDFPASLVSIRQDQQQRV